MKLQVLWKYWPKFKLDSIVIRNLRNFQKQNLFSILQKIPHILWYHLSVTCDNPTRIRTPVACSASMFLYIISANWTNFGLFK